MKRKLIAALLALVLVGCSFMAVLTVAHMGRTWRDSTTCFIGSLASQDLSLLTVLHPDLGWTAYAQSAPQQVISGALSTRTAQAAVLSFLGVPGRIAFFPVISGRLPQDGERGACALDKDTAFRLFGSVDPGEVSVRLNGELVRVVGVMDAPRPLVLVVAARDEVFNRLAADNRDALLTLATALGIEPDPFELSGAELVRLAWLLCTAPWLLAVVLALATLRNLGGNWRVASTVLFCGLSLGVLLALLVSVPAWLLPTRWSDLAFYGEQMAAWNARPFRAPDVRDELLKSDMLRVGLLNVTACITLWMKRMWLRCEKSY